MSVTIKNSIEIKAMRKSNRLLQDVFAGLREMIRRGESVRYYIPDSVIDYILLNGIYRNNHEKESSGEHI